MRADFLSQITGIGDRPAVNTGDHVAGFNAGLDRRAIGLSYNFV